MPSGLSISVDLSDVEREGRAPLQRCIGPDVAAMLPDDALHRREAHAGTGKFVDGVEPLKHAEQLVRVLHVEADAVVANEDGRLTHILDDADLDHGWGAPARVLDRVRQEVADG